MAKFNRVLLKLSGEALAGAKGHGIDNDILNEMASEIADVVRKGVGVALVIGGGNMIRGVSASAGGMNRAQGDAMGMLGTVMNGLAMQDALDKQGINSVVMSAIRMEPICEFFNRRRAIELLANGSVVIFSAGTGNPFFTTDSCGALRSVEIKADLLLKGTRVDGVYTKDPEKFTDAVKYEDVTFEEAYSKGLHIMDLTAFTLCRENNMPIIVFDINREDNLLRLVQGEKIGTLIHN